MKANKEPLFINTESGEGRWYIIQHFCDWFTSCPALREDLHQSLQLYIQQEIWKENE